MESKVRHVFASGITRSVDHRLHLLKQLKTEILAQEAEIIRALFSDLGKSEWETRSSEIGIVVAEINHILEHLREWSAPKYIDAPLTAQPASARIIPSPLGTVLVIAPWNYPFNLAFSPLVAAIAAGNTAILKPSELAPKTSAVIAKIVANVFVAGEVLTVEGGVHVVTPLLTQPFDHIFFTGSTRVGKIIAHAAAENLAGCTLELGGKSPCIVDASVNLFHTARKIAWGKTFNAGQTCVAPDYLLVHESIHEQMIQAISSQWLDFFGADPEQSPDYGRIVNEEHFDRLVGFLNHKPAQIIGGKSRRTSKYLQPTLVTHINDDHPIMADEIFGPLLPVFKWSNLQDLEVHLAKHPHPLAFYVFSKDEKFCEDLIQRHSFGGGCTNHIAHHLGSSDLPFGGVRTSGIGQYHGKFGFDTFTHYKSILDAHPSFDLGIKYPPYKNRAKWLKWLHR